MNNKLKDLLLYEPHNMLISGATNCGKTYFVLDLIEKYYKKFFNHIVIFCPTFFYNKTYKRNWIDNDDGVIIMYPEAVKENLDQVLKFCIDVFKGSNTLFILDDCANLQDSKKKVSELCHLAFSGRHYGITTWVLNQKYNSIVKDFRENIRTLILFFNKDETAMKQALEENHIIPKGRRDEIINKLKERKGCKLIIRLQFPFDYMLLI